MTNKHEQAMRKCNDVKREYWMSDIMFQQYDITVDCFLAVIETGYISVYAFDKDMKNKVCVMSLINTPKNLAIAQLLAIEETAKLPCRSEAGRENAESDLHTLIDQILEDGAISI